MMDRMTVSGIRAWGHHGVLPHERELGQEFLVDLDVEVDLATAAASDDLADTVDYGRLAQQAHDVVTGEPVQLIEALATRIAEVVLRHHRVTRVTVTVRKPSAPVTVPLSAVAVSITRPTT